MKRIALTGGIASGKSTVEAVLKRHGVPVVDSDALTHSLYDTPELKAHVFKHFGPTVFENNDPTEAVNRKALGAIVFEDAAKRTVLTDYIHPRVKRETEAFFQAHEEAPLVVASIPLLFEVYPLNVIREGYDGVWLVATTPQHQLARLMGNRGLSEAEAEVRIASQTPIEDKVALLNSEWRNEHDAIIVNSDTLETLEVQVEALLDI